MSRTLEERAAKAVARELAQVPPHQRGDMMRTLARHAIAGVQAVEGAHRAAEDAYRLADSVVGDRKIARRE